MKITPVKTWACLAEARQLMCGCTSCNYWLSWQMYGVMCVAMTATPGRLVDHLENTKGFHLRGLKYLVMDEADRILNMDFQTEVSEQTRRDSLRVHSGFTRGGMRDILSP